MLCADTASVPAGGGEEQAFALCGGWRSGHHQLPESQMGQI